MLEIILSIAKYFTLILSGLYIYIKLSNIKLRPSNLIDIVVAAVMAVAIYYAAQVFKLFVPLLLFFTIQLYSFVRYRQTLLKNFIMTTISMGISVFIMEIANLIAFPICYIVYFYTADEVLRDSLVRIIICVLLIVATFSMFKIKRFRNGISLQKNDGYTELLLLASILCIILFSIFYTDDILNSYIELIMVGIFICGLTLLSWWRKNIHNAYTKQIFSRNELIYEKRIEEFETERAELIKQNNELSKIIHRDNKLIPAMLNAVNKLIETSAKTEELTLLLDQLNELSAERKNVIADYQSSAEDLPKTNVVALDAALHFLHNKALQNKVEFRVDLNYASINLIISKTKNMTELVTILCDLGENAVIAAKSRPDGKVLLSFGLVNELTPYFSFYDNGDYFDKKVLSNLGRRRTTTHKAEGGSGIGIMSLFEILDNFKASFLLDEHIENNEFTKCIKITFDGLQNINISSNN